MEHGGDHDDDRDNENRQTKYDLILIIPWLANTI